MIPLPDKSDTKLRFCPRCELNLPESDFGVDRSRADGLNMYDRVCIRKKVYASRTRKRAYNKVVKPPVPAAPLWQTNLNAVEKVLTAIKRGATTQQEIRRATRLSVNEMTDGLADLYADNKLNRNEMKQRRYVAA